MITGVEYMQIVSEVYDLSDYATKQNVLFCNESKRVDNIEHIVSSLYLHIKNDVAGIDFGTIPKSRGVITRVENYSELCECINSVRELVKVYGERSDVIDEISTCLANIQQRERVFSKAFALNIEFPMMMYNMAALAAVSSVSLLLAGTIEYVKNGHDSFNVAFDKVGYNKTREHVLYEFLVQFNRNCNTNAIDKLMDACMKNNLTVLDESMITDETLESIMEAGGNYQGINVKDIIGTIGAVKGLDKIKKSEAVKKVVSQITKTKLGKFAAIVIGIGAAIITLLWAFKKLAFTFMYCKMKLSDWFEIQAQYLQINAENLKYRDDDNGNDHRRNVYQSQMKWVDRFKKIANALAIKSSAAQKAAEDDERASRNRTYSDSDDEDDGGLF